MDYRANFAHLLRHMVRELPVECERGCPVVYHKDGGTTWGSAIEINYTGPSLENLFIAMRETGLAADVRIVGHSYAQYFPTTSGIEYLQQYKNPTFYWIKNNWFPALVAFATLAVAIANIYISQV